MPLTPGVVNPLPYFWSFYGHSYYQGAFGTHAPAGRADSIMRNLFTLDQMAATKNHAMIGARATYNGNPQAGWTRLFQNEKGNQINPGYPDIAYDGAFFLGWGINDLAIHGNTVQNNTAYQHALRACISRCRCARSWDANSATFIYGTGFVIQNFAWETSSGDSYYQATATTNATISWTIPADYHGGAIVFCFLAKPGILGATFTWGGTAGVTGTTSTSNILPAASGAGLSPVVRRITTLTAANASQTITLTVTAIDAGGQANFLGSWVESPYPPPVLVANTARMNALGYAVNTYLYTSSLNGTAVTSTPATITLASGTTMGLSGQGGILTIPSAGGTVTITYTGIGSTTTITGCSASGGSGNYTSNTLTMAGAVDADVVTFNSYLTTLIPEFDAMVQIVDLDSAINKDTGALGSDGLHPSELGAARIADAFRAAASRLTPSSAYGESSQLNVPNQALAPLYLPKVHQGWFTSPGCQPSVTAYTPVAQDMFAVPFTCTSQAETWVNWSVEVLGGSAPATVFFGIYDDRSTTGLPKHLYSAPCATVITLPTGAGIYVSPAAPTNGGLILGPDPGLYWLVLLIVTTGTGVTFRTMKGPGLLTPQLNTSGSFATSACGWKAATAGTVLPASWPFPFDPALNTISDNCPVIGIKVF